MAEAAKKTEIDLMAIDPSRDRAAGAQEAAGEKKPGRFKHLSMVIYLLAGMLILSGGTMAAVFLGWINVSSPAAADPKKPGAATVQRPEKPREIGPTLKLSSLVINLNEAPGSHFIKTVIVLEVAKEEYLEEIKSRTAPLTDIVILTLGEQRLSDLRNPAYKDRLKEDLLLRMNRRLQATKIRQVYFDEFLYQ